MNRLDRAMWIEPSGSNPLLKRGYKLTLKMCHVLPLAIMQLQGDHPHIGDHSMGNNYLKELIFFTPHQCRIGFLVFIPENEFSVKCITCYTCDVLDLDFRYDIF